MEGTSTSGRSAGPGRRLRMQVALLVAIWVSGAAGGCGSGSTPASAWDYVLAPEQVHFGGSYSDWSVLWWQWAIELPLTNHPLFDTTGVHAAEGQVEPVWFIGGIFGSLFAPSDGSATRDITIPGDVALFFPVINVEWDNDYCVPPGWVDRTAAELAAMAYDSISAVEDVYCELDGTRLIDAPNIKGAQRFRAISGTFAAQMPTDNIAVASCGDPAGPELVSPAVSDGIWMMLRPLPPGVHTIRFGGRVPVGGGGYFEIAIEYHVTVLP